MRQKHPKIRAEHLNRRAAVYLRQSSMRQVRENLESQRLQYALADRARTLGWQDIEVIDADLGVSAAVGSTRAGFERLIAAVALGEIGIIFSREVSRLSRTDKDYCQLLEVCQSFKTLIGDDEQVYDLDLIDDQLVLGIKGTMSVVELEVLKLRMWQGRLEKARRGEYFSRLPPGYVLDSAGKVVIDPDERVRKAVALVFRKFRELWSGRQTCHWFRDQEMRLPVNRCSGGSVELVWQLPKSSFIHDILSNPFYAGVYFHGRGTTEMRWEDGKLVKRRTRCTRSAEECEVFIRDHHEGYIDWRTYEENRQRMSRNVIGKGAESGVAAVRKGQGLLAGLLRCGHCGRKLHVRYWGRKGTAARYFCDGDYREGGNYCIAFGGAKVDRRLASEILEVISPLGVEASLRALEKIRASESEQIQALKLELQQLDFEVQRAFEQYDQVDPRNRLVAAELERRWNVTLQAHDRLRARITSLEAEMQPLCAEEEARIRSLGEDFAGVWEDSNCPIELKKKIAHTVIEEIVARLEEDTLRFVIHWKGGSHTQLEMPKPRSGAAQKTPPKALEVIRKLAPRYGDDQIAAVLSKLGLRTGKGLRWTRLRAASARHRYGIPGQSRTVPDPEIFSLAKAAHYCDVGTYVISCLVERGFLANGQTIPMAPWEIARSELDSERVHLALKHYRRTGRVPEAGGIETGQMTLTTENEGDRNGRCSA